jgi:hypothetical protein
MSECARVCPQNRRSSTHTEEMGRWVSEWFGEMKTVAWQDAGLS